MKFADMLKDTGGKKKAGVYVSFKALIDAYLNRRGNGFAPFRAELQRNDIVGFHPSGLHNACPRQIAFQYINEKGAFNTKKVDVEDFDTDHLSPRIRRLFDFGHLIHMLYQYGYLPDYDKDIAEAEVSIKKLYEEYLIGGTTDLIVILQDGKKYVGDIKTARSESFNKTKTADDVDTGYIVQLNIYMFGLGIPRGFVYIVNKNDSDDKEFFYEMDKEILKPILNTCKKAKSFLSGESTPEILRECTNKTGKYKSCQFSGICFRCKTHNDILGFTNRKSNKDLIKLEYKK